MNRPPDAPPAFQHLYRVHTMSTAQPPEPTTVPEDSSTQPRCPSGFDRSLWNRLLELRQLVALAGHYFSHANLDGRGVLRSFHGTLDDIHNLSLLRAAPQQCVLDLHDWIHTFRETVQRRYPRTALPAVPVAPTFGMPDRTGRLGPVDYLACCDGVNALAPWVDQTACVLRGSEQQFEFVVEVETSDQPAGDPPSGPRAPDGAEPDAPPEDYLAPPERRPDELRALIRAKRVLFEVAEEKGALIHWTQHLEDVDSRAHDYYTHLRLDTPPPGFGDVSTCAAAIAALRDYERWFANAQCRDERTDQNVPEIGSMGGASTDQKMPGPGEAAAVDPDPLAQIRDLITVSVAGIAKAVGCPEATVESFLRRLRNRKPSCYFEAEADVRRVTDPKYFYRVPEIIGDLDRIVPQWLNRYRRTSDGR